MGVIWAWFESDHTCHLPFKNPAYAHDELVKELDVNISVRSLIVIWDEYDTGMVSQRYWYRTPWILQVFLIRSIRPSLHLAYASI